MAGRGNICDLGQREQGRTKTSLGNLKQSHSAARPHKSSFYLFIYLNCRENLNSKGLTFIARAMRAPSVGCPITLFFLITALLTTQPAWGKGQVYMSWFCHYWSHSFFISLNEMEEGEWRLEDGGLGDGRSHIPKVLGKTQQHHLRLVFSKAT